MITSYTECSPAARLPKILLVYPQMPGGTYWSFDTALHLLNKKCLLPPLGLCTIAAMLPQETPMRLVDLNVAALENADLDWADYLFVSAMIVQDRSLREVIVRANAAGLPVVAGGPHPSSSYANLPGVDHFVIGEAEPLMQQVFDDLLAGRPRKAYARPVDRTHADALCAFFGDDADIAQAEERPAMETTPVPRFDLLEMNAYKSMAVQSSRGCPVGCEFCDIWRRFGRKPRCKSAQKILDELEALYELGWRNSVFIVDDNFIGDKRRCKDILHALGAWQRERGYPFDFITEATLTLADDPELLEGFYRAQLNVAFIGIETPVEESLRETRKHINTTRSIAERVRTIQAHGIEVTAGFILGFDADPDDIADRMIGALNECGLPIAMLGVLTAMPETDLHDRLVREERLLKESTGNNTHTFEVNFRTKRPPEQVLADYKRILRTIYPPDLKSYFDRCRTFRARYGTALTERIDTGPIDSWRVGVFLRLLPTLPFKRYGWNAIKYLLGTAWKKPECFVYAVSHVIQGHHYRAITRNAFEVEKMERILHKERLAFEAAVRDYATALSHCRDAAGVLGQQALAEVFRRRRRIARRARRNWRRLSHHARVLAAGRYESFVAELHTKTEELAALESFFAEQHAAFRHYAADCHASASLAGQAWYAHLRQRRDEIAAAAAARMQHLSDDTRRLAAERYDGFVRLLESYTGDSGYAR